MKENYPNSHVHTDMCVHTPEDDTEGPPPITDLLETDDASATRD